MAFESMPYVQELLDSGALAANAVLPRYGTMLKYWRRYRAEGRLPTREQWAARWTPTPMARTAGAFAEQPARGARAKWKAADKAPGLVVQPGRLPAK